MKTYQQWLLEQKMIATLAGDELTPEEIALEWRYYQKRALQEYNSKQGPKDH
jgi:hypothetical protein